MVSTRIGLLGGEYALKEAELDSTWMIEAYIEGFKRGVQYSIREFAQKPTKTPSERKRAVAVETNKLRSEWHHTALFHAGKLLAGNPQYPLKNLHIDVAHYINSFEHPSMRGRKISASAVKKLLERRRRGLDAWIKHLSR